MSPIEIIILIISIVIAITLVILSWFFITNNTFNKLENEIEESKIILNTSIITFYEVFLHTFKECVLKYQLNEKDFNNLLNFKRPELTDSFEKKQKFVYSFFKLIRETVETMNKNEIIKNSGEFHKCLEKINKEIESLHGARRVYNANVSYFNQKIITFPHKIIANFRGLKNYQFFETELL